ncbi:hypothetical protein LCGC14_1188050 [marine sediment metagenome]|uniref:Flavodoxin-like domain-containing protein n=1 Tax=marine sediment metagenome TaxID=412755 RepID=A0A0F9M7X9_9ZZZZ
MNNLKILITYYSNTGNTEKVANSLKAGLMGEVVDLTPIKDVDPSSLKNYDLVFLGSGIYAIRVNKSLSELLSATEELPPNFAFFCTHASLNMYQDGFKIVKRKLAKTGSEIIDVFDCMGENIGIPEVKKKEMLERLPPEKQKEAEEHQNRLKGRPNAEDLEKAK